MPIVVPYKLYEFCVKEKLRNSVELYNVTELHIFENELLILGWKPTFHHRNSFLLLYDVALDVLTP